MNRKTYYGLITDLLENQVFVFGSNPQGRHGKGTAKIALNKYNAIYGQGHGLQGRSYGLVTKNLKKGYAILKSDNKIVKSVQSLKKLEFFDVTLKDGVINIKKKL